MAEKQELAWQSTEQDSAWRALLLHILPKSERLSRMNVVRCDESSENDPYTSYGTYFFDALSPGRAWATSTEKDLSALGQLFSALQQVVSDKIITDDEAVALMKYVASKFVERRVDCILSDAFGGEPEHRRTFHKIAGSVRHGRGCKSSR